MRRVFVDTHRRRHHCCYDPGDEKFFTINSLAELADGYDEIYVDSALFPNMWDDLRKLIHAGKTVFYFARPWLWREVRKQYSDELKRKLNAEVKKTDFSDAYLLSRIYEVARIELNVHKVFRPITIIDVELKPILMLERDLRRVKMRLENRKRLGIDVLNELKKVEEELEDIRLRLIEMVREVAPWMIETAKIIGVAESISGTVGLIGVLTYFKGSSYHQALRFLGLYKAKDPLGRRLKKCSRVAREYLVILAESIHRNNGFPWLPRLKDLRQILRMVMNTAKIMSPPGGG